MGWFSQKREIAELRKQVAQLSQAIAHLHQPAGPDPNRMLEVLIDGQVKQVDSFGGFIRMISEVAAERTNSAFGRRGGRKRAATAQRDERGRMIAGPKRLAQTDCLLCEDATCADFSSAEFEAHILHKGRRARPQRIEPTAEEREIVEREPIEVQSHTEYPLPHVQHPMVPIATGNETDRAGSDSQGQEPAPESHRNGVA